MNWYRLFYWVTVADGIKDVLSTASTFFMWGMGVAALLAILMWFGSNGAFTENGSYQSSGENEFVAKCGPWNKKFRRYFFLSMILCIFCSVLNAFVPGKKDALIIISGGAVGSFIQHDSSVKQIPGEVMTLLRDKIRTEINDLHHPDVVDSLKSLSKEQLIERVKSLTK